MCQIANVNTHDHSERTALHCVLTARQHFVWNCYWCVMPIYWYKTMMAKLHWHLPATFVMSHSQLSTIFQLYKCGIAYGEVYQIWYDKLPARGKFYDKIGTVNVTWILFLTTFWGDRFIMHFLILLVAAFICNWILHMNIHHVPAGRSSPHHPAACNEHSMLSRGWACWK